MLATLPNLALNHTQNSTQNSRTISATPPRKPLHQDPLMRSIRTKETVTANYFSASEHLGPYADSKDSKGNMTTAVGPGTYVRSLRLSVRFESAHSLFALGRSSGFPKNPLELVLPFSPDAMCADFVALLNITEAIPYTLTIFPEGTRLTESKLRDSQDGEANFWHRFGEKCLLYRWCHMFLEKYDPVFVYWLLSLVAQAKMTLLAPQSSVEGVLQIQRLATVGSL